MIKTIKTKGMHCSNCEKTIEKTALAADGVVSAKSNFAKEETTIKFNENKINLSMIIEAISNKGYKCSEVKGTKKEGKEDYYSLSLPSSKYILIAGSILFLLGLFWLMSYSFRFSLPEITPNMGFALIFVIGLLTSFHCVGMCGGFVLSYTTKGAIVKAQTKSKLLSHLKYGIGKTITYTMLGALFGLLGSFIVFTPSLKGVAALIAGAFLIIYGLNTANIFPWLRRLQFKGPKALDKINANAAKGNKSPFIMGSNFQCRVVLR